MRIIAGQLKGGTFESPQGHRTHPMSEKARGALFNVLGDIKGLSVLDAFAGTGALTFEALSRGAAHAILLERDTTAQRVILANIGGLGVQAHAHLVHASANAWLGTTDAVFDLVLLDPPYDDLQPILLTGLANRTKPGGVVVLSLPPAAVFPLGSAYELLTTHDYGDAMLVFYRRIS